MAIIPKRNLPPEAGKWARWVEDNIGTLAREVERVVSNARAASHQLNASARAASDTVAEMQEQARTIVRDREVEQETQAALTETANNLEDARQALEEAQEWIDTTGDSLNTRLTDAETALADAEDILTNLEDVDLPALRERLDDAEYDVKHISGEWITAGTIDAERLNALAVAAAVGQFIELDVSQLVASGATIGEAVIEKLWTDVVRARKITADMMIVGSGDNMVPDPYFAVDAVADAWTTSGTVAFQRPTTPAGRDAGARLNTTAATLRSSRMVATEGDQYRVVFWAANITTLLANRVFCDVQFYDTTGVAIDTPVTITNTESIPSATWTRFEQMVPAPAGTAFMDITFRRAGSPVVYSLPSVVKATDASLIVDGGIVARHLGITNPQPGPNDDPETFDHSGMILEPQGLTLKNSNDSEAVELRTDRVQTLSFTNNGETTFAVTPEGDMSGRSLSASDSVVYRGTELQSLLDAFPRGLMAHARTDAAAVVGTSQARLLQVSVRTPTSNRDVRITLRTHTSNGAGRMVYRIRQSDQPETTGSNTSIATFQTPARATNESSSNVFEVVSPTTNLGWPTDTTISLGVWVQCQDSGKTGAFDPTNGQEIIVEDLGPATAFEYHTPYVPSSGGGSGGGGGSTAPTKRLYTQTFSPTWTRSYKGDNTFYDFQPGRLYSGQYLSANKSLRSMVGFNTAAISSFTGGSGTEMVSGRVYLKNTHTYSSSGASTQLGVHTATSAPSTFSEHSSIRSEAFGRGQARWLDLGTALDGFKNGNRGGIVLRAPGFSPSLAYYSYFDAASVRLELTVRK